MRRVAPIREGGWVEDPRRLVGTAKAAAMLDVDRTTLWRWYKAGAIKPALVTPSGRTRWDVDQIRRQLAAREQEAYFVPQQPATSPEEQPVVAAIVTSHLGVLAGKRRDGKPPWTFIAGEVEPGESIADAAVREVKEEAGLLVRAAHIEIGRRVHPKTQRTMIYLACLPTHGADIHVGDPDELEDVRWLSLAEVDQLLPGMFDPVREHLGRLIS